MSRLIALIGLLHGRLSKARMTLHGQLFGFASSSSDPRPVRMYKGDRGVDTCFKGWHQLYRRCKQEDLIDNRLNPTRIKYSNTSVNWSKFSKPWDVIFDYPDHGVVRFFVRDLPEELPKEKPAAGPLPKLYSFVAEHFPEENNYSHSQIMTYKENVRVTAKLPSTVKKEFKTIMCDRSLVLLEPKL